MTLLLDDVERHLENEGLAGGTSGWCIQKHFLQPQPDQVILIMESGGGEPEQRPDGTTDVEYDEPTFQIRGRGKANDYQPLRVQMGKIYRSIHGSELGKPGDYVQVRALNSGPLPMGLDKKNRPEMAWNFIAMRDRAADDDT